MALYGQFIGSWDANVVSHEPTGAKHTGSGEIHFGWNATLEKLGKALSALADGITQLQTT